MIVLPTTPLPNAETPRAVDTGAWQRPIAGGSGTRLERLGTHLAIDFSTPKLTYVRDARIWLVRVLQAISLPARAVVVQPGISIGVLGTPVVDGGGQTGTSIKLRGLVPNYPLVEGQAFNVTDAAGINYLHLLTADGAIGGDGRITIGVWPPLRSLSADNSHVELAQPVIEGQLTGADKGMTLKKAMADGISFSIEEIR